LSAHVKGWVPPAFRAFLMSTTLAYVCAREKDDNARIGFQPRSPSALKKDAARETAPERERLTPATMRKLPAAMTARLRESQGGEGGVSGG